MSEPDRFRLIGDPHITRKFEVGVPLARRGEREKSLFADFQKRLWEGKEPTLIMVGDLFEKPICSLQDLYSILNLILFNARSRFERTFVLMAGNHDISPQAETYGAFDILRLFDNMLPNLRVVVKPTVINRIALFPWEWERSAVEQLEDVKGLDFDMAVGHWDLVAYDENHTDHLCPAKALTEMGAKEIYSGHWHIKDDYKIDGITVHCTGSMQPMTHAEDPDGKMYVTMTLAEYESVDLDHDTLKDKYVRVVAESDEEVEILSDCLGFKVQRKVTDDGDWTGADVKVEDFKVSDIIEKHMKHHGVPSEVSKFIKERIDATD